MTTNPFISAIIIGEGVDPAVYHRQDTRRGEKTFIMSRSELVGFAYCPSKWIKGWKSPDTKSSEWGSLIDCLVLDKERFHKDWAVCPKTYPDAKTGKAKPWNWNATYCDGWLAEQQGRIPIKSEMMYKADEALKVLWADKDIAELLDVSKKQVLVMAMYLDEATGLSIPVKALIDLVPAKESKFATDLADFKTAVSAEVTAWSKAINQHAYAEQAALYIDIYNAATGEARHTMLHAIQENEPPFELGHRFVSAEFVEAGRVKYLSALRFYADCLKHNRWPSFDEIGGAGMPLIVNGVWREASPLPWMLKVA